MTLTKFDKLTILFKSRAIKEMTIEDLEVWEGFEEIYPGWIRFPESLEFVQKGNTFVCNRKKAIKYLKVILKRVDKEIKILLDGKVDTKRQEEFAKFIQSERDRLEKHLEGLRELREKRRMIKDGVIKG